MSEIIKSKLKIKKLDRIHHISDIHIRNYKRHAEYRRVFETLYNKIKETTNENDLIVLTGDIVHSKTDVTPELVNEVQDFLKALCDIAPVLMIPGNHDANLNNSHRMDALTPIVNAMANPRLEYCEKSAILRLNNVDFYHWSVFDTAENYPFPLEDSQTRIALYHGPVNDSSTEVGFVIENESMKVENFNGFDMVLLGDIHKTQFLNPQKTIAYPGSLIQQNHGEERNHGYLLWEVNSRLAEFVPIENDTAFYTVDIDSGNYTPIDETLPKNLYLRVRYRNTDQTVLREIVEDLRKQRNVVELTTQRINTFSIREKSVNESKGLDFRSLEQQRELITKYLKQKHKIKDEDLAKILEINDTVHKSLKKSEVPRNSMWIPKRFEFEDMFSYGKDNVVDFTNMKGIYGLFAPNASGKSTLLDSLTYCIFDKCTKTNRGHQVMNSNSDTFNCKLSFELNGLDYVIKRTAKRQKSGNVRVEVDFYYYDEKGDKVSLNGKDRSDTNASVRNLLGTYEDFILTTLSTQSNNTGFIDMNQKDRKDLLSQFMDIGVFEEMYTIANETARDTNALLRHYQKTDYESKLKQYGEDLLTYQELLKTNTATKEKQEKDKAKYNEKLLDLATKLQKVDDSIVDEESIQRNIVSLKNSIRAIELNMQQVSVIVQETDTSLQKLKQSIAKIDEKELEENEKACNALKDKFHSADLELQQLESHMKHKNDKMEKLKELKYDPSCKFCMENVFVKDAIKTKNDIQEDEEKLKILKTNKLKIEVKLSECEDAEVERLAYIKTRKQIAELENKLISLNAELERNESKKLRDQLQLKEAQDKLELREKQLSTIKNNQDLNEKIALLKKTLTDLETQLRATNAGVSDCQVQIKILEKSIDDTKKEIQKRKDLEKDNEHYQYYLDATHRNGIPHDIISVTIPQIEEEVNNILSQLVDFRVVFETDDKDVNAYIAYSEDRFWPLELTSGMEKFISSLAIRTSLINISTLPRPNFIAIDEGFGTLDKSNLSSMSLLFDYLKTQFKFLVIISHIDSMRDVVDSHIDIHKVKDKSLVKHQ